ncbi:GNAT superfamily N-acetyltransferase [Inquilinus ginsengisoli]|uniref:GNAT family N-acetyltransferase n=1 Tax=Inquilinus ginsengisoli TaxID=363840 RepID=UPI003D262094
MADSIRIAGPDDAPAVLDLLRAAYQPLREMGIRFTAVTADLELVRRTVERHTTFLLERDGGAVATVSVRFPWPVGERHLASYPFIHWFAVAPRLKRQGVGSALLQHVEDDFLRDRVKAPAVYLATATRHPWLRGIYERRGYQAFHRQPSSRGEEMVFLRKILLPEIYRDLEVAELKRSETEGLALVQAGAA